MLSAGCWWTQDIFEKQHWLDQINNHSIEIEEKNLDFHRFNNNIYKSKTALLINNQWT